MVPRMREVTAALRKFFKKWEDSLDILAEEMKQKGDNFNKQRSETDGLEATIERETYDEMEIRNEMEVDEEIWGNGRREEDGIIDDF